MNIIIAPTISLYPAYCDLCTLVLYPDPYFHSSRWITLPLHKKKKMGLGKCSSLVVLHAPDFGCTIGMQSDHDVI